MWVIWYVTSILFFSKKITKNYGLLWLFSWQGLGRANDYFQLAPEHASYISSVVELQSWWVLKRKIFGQESTSNLSMYYGSSKSANILLSKSIFHVKNRRSFSKKNHLIISIWEFWKEHFFNSTIFTIQQPNW